MVCKWTIVRRINYKNGKQEGIVEEWHENGQLSSRVNYKNGIKEGLKEKYDRNGNPIDYEDSDSDSE